MLLMGKGIINAYLCGLIPDEHSNVTYRFLLTYAAAKTYVYRLRN